MRTLAAGCETAGTCVRLSSSATRAVSRSVGNNAVNGPLGKLFAKFLMECIYLEASHQRRASGRIGVGRVGQPQWTTHRTTATKLTIADLPKGVYCFHVRARNGAGFSGAKQPNAGADHGRRAARLQRTRGD